VCVKTHYPGGVWGGVLKLTIQVGFVGVCVKTHYPGGGGEVNTHYPGGGRGLILTAQHVPIQHPHGDLVVTQHARFAQQDFVSRVEAVKRAAQHHIVIARDSSI
jgi:hypothetical protein